MASRDYKTPRATAPNRSGSPLLVGIVIGILLGLAVALAVALYLFKVPAPFMPRESGGKATAEPASKPLASTSVDSKPDRVRAPAGPSEQEGTTQTDRQDGEKPRFDFYKILPGTEQATKERGGKSGERKAAATSVPAAPASGGGAEMFYLQAGAFQNAADADDLKARLALAGIEARVLTAELPEGKVWHRVRVGPLHDVDEVGRVRERLKQNQIEATLVKEKGKSK